MIRQSDSNVTRSNNAASASASAQFTSASPRRQHRLLWTSSRVHSWDSHPFALFISVCLVPWNENYFYLCQAVQKCHTNRTQGVLKGIWVLLSYFKYVYSYGEFSPLLKRNKFFTVYVNKIYIYIYIYRLGHVQIHTFYEERRLTRCNN